MSGSSRNGRAASASGKTIRIGSRVVGEGLPCFVIAEAGVNHNGRLDLAEQLVRIAADARADAVKLQKRSIPDILIRDALDAPYVKATSLGATYGEHRQRLELAEEDWRRLQVLAVGLGLEFLGSAWDKRSADFLESLDAPAFKVASADLTNLDLLDHLARKGRPMLVSTGMSSIEEIDEAVNCVLRRNADLVLLQCTSTYPAEFADVNLRVMQAYRERYGVLVGYSGHERGIAVAAAAATLGACVVEKHFTIDRTMPGPDHAASLEPIGLAKLVRDVRHIEEALGTAQKRILPAEVPIRERLAKSVAAACDIPAGAVIERHMVTVKGPGNGIPANSLAAIVGRVAGAPVAADTLLPTEALSWELAAT